MKKILSLMAGTVLLIAFGHAYAAESTSDTMDRSGKTITNENLPTATPDEGGATFNQMPAAPDSEGSGAGGMGSDTESLKKDDNRNSGTTDVTPMEPRGKMPDNGGYGKGGYDAPGY